MLPDDLENLSQSVIATNFFSNNILQSITVKNYWDVVNEFKPLMHTWSLGIEEQYYFLYPIIFLFIKKNKNLLTTLVVLTIISLVIYILPFKDYHKFYLLPFRIFELSIGGIIAILLNKKTIDNKLLPLFSILLIYILFFPTPFISDQIKLLLVVFLTSLVICSSAKSSSLSALLLENKIVTFIGLISFSMYMWHQPLLAYTRYCVTQKITPINYVTIFAATLLLSLITYYIIERPFRNKNKISTPKLFIILIPIFLITNIASFHIYLKAGVLKDIPELDIKKSNIERGYHAKYNSRVYSYDKPFDEYSNKLKILIIGNSYARDWANILFESKYKDKLDISYIYDPFSHQYFPARSKQANIIFYSLTDKDTIEKLDINKSNLFIIGTKNFGINSGYFYNYKGDDYFLQRTPMENGYLEENEFMKEMWGDRYINYIDKIIDENLTVPVFTPDKMFISQDCRHLTQAGAAYFAVIFENELQTMFQNAKSDF